MKNMKKVILAATAFVAAGLVLAFGALAAMDFDFKKMNTLHYVTNTYSVDEVFSNISVESAECDIRLIPAEDDFCKVICEESEEIFHSVTVKNNTLTIERTDARKWYEHLGVYWGRMVITVYLPQSEYESLHALTLSGDITIPEDFSFADAEIYSTSGDIDFLAPVEKDLSLKTVSGSLYAKGINPETLDIQSTSGKIKCSDMIVSGNINLKTVSGNIELKSCDADSLYLKSTSGKISGTLLSEKQFLTDTTSGKVNVPESTSGGKCEIKTTSGNIQFEIE